MKDKAAPLALLVVLLVAGCVNPFAPRPTHWDAQIKLTVITSPRAGAEAEDVALAVEQATDAFNASGIGVTYRIINDNMPDGIAKAMDRLVKGRPAAFIAALGPDEAKPALDKAAAAKIPLILVTPSQLAPTGASAAWFLQASADPAFAGRAVAALAEEEGAGKVVVFADTDAATTRALEALRAQLGDAVAREVLVSEPSTAGALARQACDARADAVALLVTPSEGAALVRGLEEAGCRSSVAILAAPWVRQNELVEGAGRRSDGKPLAEGVLGVSPARTEPGVFRGGFESVYGRAPSRLAAPAHDAVAYATLAALRAKGSPGADPFQGTIGGADVGGRLLEVAASPGLKADDIVAAAEAAKAGDDVDWIGFDHDLDYEGRSPRAGDHEVWRVNAAGGFETTGATVAI